MKLTIKTLQQSTFKLEIEPDKTVKELKDQIEKDHGKDYPSGAQKLIYNGKILADESKLAEYNIDEKKFIVLMITRPPPAPKPPVEAEKVKKEEPTDAKPKGSDDSKQAKPSTTDAPTSQSSSTSTTVSNTATSAPTTTPNTTTGQQSAIPPAAAATTNRSATRVPSAMSDVSALSADPQIGPRLASLMMQPQFRQIQDLIQQSPHLLSSTIEALALSDPEMYNFITENPDVFVNALNHPPLARQNTGRGSTTRQGTPQQAGRIPAGRQPIVDQLLVDISDHDKEAIERLKELGFPELLAVQAYMACDRDEELAANLLLTMDT